MKIIGDAGENNNTAAGSSSGHRRDNAPEGDTTDRGGDGWTGRCGGWRARLPAIDVIGGGGGGGCGGGYRPRKMITSENLRESTNKQTERAGRSPGSSVQAAAENWLL
jgi:hypothetical protein